MADALVTLSSMYKVNYPNEAPLIKMDPRDEPSVCFTIEEESDGKPLYHDIKCLHKKQDYLARASMVTEKLYKDLLPYFSSTKIYSIKETTTLS